MLEYFLKERPPGGGTKASLLFIFLEHDIDYSFGGLDKQFFEITR